MKQNRKGFTIIEVVLVLAIAGLIFLMVFIALPALQRSQRNTQRKNDLSRFMTAITQYQANNNNNIVFNKSGDISGDLLNFTKRYIDDSCSSASVNPNHDDLYMVSGCSAQFQDPDGENYNWDVRGQNWAYHPNDMPENVHLIFFPLPDGDSCSGLGSTGGYCTLPASNTHYIAVFSGAKCYTTEGYLVKTNQRNNIAVMTPLEGGSIACVDNQ